MELHALWMYLASFVKQHWTAQDYPLRWIRQDQPPDLTNTNDVTVPWRVHIVRWTFIFRARVTKQAALADL